MYSRTSQPPSSTTMGSRVIMWKARSSAVLKRVSTVFWMSNSALKRSDPVMSRRCFARQDNRIGEKVSGRKNKVRIKVAPERMTAIQSVHRQSTFACTIQAPTTGERAVPQNEDNAITGHAKVRCTGPKMSAVEAAWMASKMLPLRPARKRKAQ